MLGFLQSKNLGRHVRGCPTWAIDWGFAPIIANRMWSECGW